MADKKATPTQPEEQTQGECIGINEFIKGSDNLPDNQTFEGEKKPFSVIQAIRDGVGVIDPKPTKTAGQESRKVDYFSAADLLRRDVEFIPCLVEPILPTSGISAVGGASDTGKSSLLRQLAIDVCTGDTFLGFPMKSRHKRAIYVSTEDDETAVSFLLNKQNKDLLLHPDKFSDLLFIFDTEDLIERLDRLLTEKPADLVVVDCFTDLYGRSMNQANEVRTFLNEYSQLANKHQCLVMFLHHTGKGRENDLPSKNNLLGSQAFEAKMRILLELRNDLVDDRKKHLCIVKGNYLPGEMKRDSFVLNFSDNLVFSNTGDRCRFDLLVKNEDGGKQDRDNKVMEMVKAGYTYDQIRQATGLKSKGSISKIIQKERDVSETFPKETQETKQETESGKLPF
jgi:archaellum biogenesis ATPase FlaH